MKMSMIVNMMKIANKDNDEKMKAGVDNDYDDNLSSWLMMTMTRCWDDDDDN